MSKFRVVALISGRGSNLEALLRSASLPGAPFEVVAVVSDRADAQGLNRAREFSVPTFVVERRREERSLQEFFQELVDTVVSQKPDLVVLAGFMRIVPEMMIERLNGRIINIHPSLLPAFKGLNAQQQALEAGVKVTGCSVHWVVPDVDAGEIIAQATVPILEGDTVETLSNRILAEEHRILPEVVRKLAMEHRQS